MAKQSKSQKCVMEVKTPKAPEKCVERNLAAINPTKEQFEPTEAMPMPQHQRMAGAG